jgi:hypothetical protein
VLAQTACAPLQRQAYYLGLASSLAQHLALQNNAQIVDHDYGFASAAESVSYGRNGAALYPLKHLSSWILEQRKPLRAHGVDFTMLEIGVHTHGIHFIQGPHLIVFTTPRICSAQT